MWYLGLIACRQVGSKIASGKAKRFLYLQYECYKYYRKLSLHNLIHYLFLSGTA